MSDHQLAEWLPAATPALAAAIVRRALLDVGIVEIPPGSNRSPRIDEYCLAAKVPVGSYWCAAAVAAWWRESGAEIPAYPAGCDEWMAWARQTHRWATTPAAGAAVLYGKPGDASHIGVVVRVTPMLLSCEGNTSFGGYTRNGVGVALKEVDTARVLGYVLPMPGGGT